MRASMMSEEHRTASRRFGEANQMAFATAGPRPERGRGSAFDRNSADDHPDGNCDALSRNEPKDPERSACREVSNVR